MAVNSKNSFRKETEERLGIVYKITIGDYFYIGSTLHVINRKTSHLNNLLGRKHINTLLQNAYNKHKEFKFEILKSEIPELILKDVESIWIGALCSKVKDEKKGCNITDGRFGGVDKMYGKRETIDFTKVPVSQLYYKNGPLKRVWVNSSKVFPDYSVKEVLKAIRNKKGKGEYNGYGWRLATEEEIYYFLGEGSQRKYKKTRDEKFSCAEFHH